MDDLSSAPKKALGALLENQRKTTELPTEFFCRKFLPRKIISSQNLSVYTNRIADERYIFFEKLQRCDGEDFFQMILPTELPRDSKWDSRTMTWHFYRRNHRQNMSVGDSIGKSQYIPTLPTLSSSVSPSSSPSSSPSHLSPLKLQPTTHLISPLFSTQALKFLILLYMVTTFVLVDFIIFCK